MNNVVRLINGGSIQVRTGVLQGIGPQGPRGIAGPQGMDGPQGTQGEQGPLGQILQMQGRENVGGTNTLAADTDALIAFGSVSYDDLSCFTSTTNTTLTSVGDYLLSCWLRFDDATAGYREVWLQTGATVIARKSVASVAGRPFYVDLAHPYRTSGGEVVNVYARSGAATAVSQGALTVTRIGSGPVGPQGPAGPQGSIGLTGAQGIQGVPGDASAGFTTYAQLLP